MRCSLRWDTILKRCWDCVEPKFQGRRVYLKGYQTLPVVSAWCCVCCSPENSSITKLGVGTRVLENNRTRSKHGPTLLLFLSYDGGVRVPCHTYCGFPLHPCSVMTFHVDLQILLAALSPFSVFLCCRVPELREFCAEHGLVLTSIQDIRCLIRERQRAEAHGGGDPVSLLPAR